MKRLGASSRDQKQQFLEFGDRIVDGDTASPTNDLESTFMTVQRTMRATSSVSSTSTMPDHLKTRTWEDIMQNTASPGMQSPSAGQRNRSRASGPRRQYRPTPLPRMGWSGAANVAFALLIIVAGFGAWRAFDSGLGGGENGPAPSGGNYAFAPMTPVPAATAEVGDVVEPISACDVSGSIPIFTAVEKTGYTGTALYLWKDQSPGQWATGDLVLRCAGEADVVLASDVYSASPGPIDGVVRLRQYPDPASAPENVVPTYVNIVTGESISFGTPTQSLALTLANGPDAYARSPWVIGVSSDGEGGLEIADLQTMETRPISEFSNVVPSERNAPWAIASEDTMVVGFRYPYGIESRDGTVIRGEEMPGDILVINGNFSNTHWISIPDELASIKEAWLSPNGEYLAVAAYSGDSFMEEQRSYAILSTTDGHLVSQSGESTRWDNASVSWVQDGTAIIFSEQQALNMLRAEDGVAAEILLETQGELFAPRTTHDPSTVVVQEYPMQDESGADTAGDYAVHIVNVDNGEATSIGGRDVNGMISWIPSVNTLAMVLPDSSEPDTTTLSFYDAVSGEHLEDVEGVPYPYSTSPGSQPLIGKSSITTTPDSATALITLGSQHMFLTEVVEGESLMRRLPTLPEPYREYNSTLSVIVSDDGTMASVIRSNDEAQIRFVLDLIDPHAEWMEIPTEEAGSSQNVWFVAAP